MTLVQQKSNIARHDIETSTPTQNNCVYSISFLTTLYLSEKIQCNGTLQGVGTVSSAQPLITWKLWLFMDKSCPAYFSF